MVKDTVLKIMELCGAEMFMIIGSVYLALLVMDGVNVNNSNKYYLVFISMIFILSSVFLKYMNELHKRK